MESLSAQTLDPPAIGTSPTQIRLGDSHTLALLCLHLEDPAHGIRVSGDDPQIGFGGAVGSAGALFPIAQGPQRDLELPRKLALRQPQLLTDLLRMGNAPQPSQLIVGERL